MIFWIQDFCQFSIHELYLLPEPMADKPLWYSPKRPTCYFPHAHLEHDQFFFVSYLLFFSQCLLYMVFSYLLFWLLTCWCRIPSFLPPLPTIWLAFYTPILRTLLKCVGRRATSLRTNKNKNSYKQLSN